MCIFKKFIKVIFSFSLLLIVSFNGYSSGSKENKPWESYSIYDESYTVFNFTETEEAFPNPMKGFKLTVHGSLPVYGNRDFKPHEYGRVYKYYIKYTDLEEHKEDTVQKIIDWSNRTWAGIEKRNIKVIPRVLLVYAQDIQHFTASMDSTYEFWPNDIPQPSSVSRWTTREFYERLEKFVKKLSEAWDNDPRVAAIEVGLWGHFGEHHIYPLRFPDGSDRIPPQAQRVLGDAFSAAFKNKKVMVRYPETFTRYQFGFYWDSFALLDDFESGNGIIRRNLWRTQMITGEVAYDWGDRSQLGSTPDETVGNNSYTDHLIDWIKRTHTSSLSWIDEYTQNDPRLTQNAARIQKALGYRYVINSAIYKTTINQGEKFNIGFKVTNVGNAPFYYQWPVEISLLNANRQPVFKKVLDVDIRTWLPGETYTINSVIDLPSELFGRTYTIAISILDPAGNRPSLRFANTNYYNGGRTPIGIIGLGVTPQNNNLGNFNLLKNDNSLSYELR